MRRLNLAVAALATTLALAACGSQPKTGSDVASLGATTTIAGSDSTPTTTIDPQEAMLAYAQCMRDNGVDMPDPQMSSDGKGVIAISGGDANDSTGGPGKIDPEGQQFKDAQAKCEPLMKEAVGSVEVDPEQQAEMRKNLLAYAQCMRDHGVDFPDPVFSDDGRVTMNASSDDSSPVDREAMDAANEACASLQGAPTFGAPPAT
jgi:hypothetical protein